MAEEIKLKQTIGQTGVIGSELMKNSSFWKEDALKRGECDKIDVLPDGTGIMIRSK